MGKFNTSIIILITLCLFVILPVNADYWGNQNFQNFYVTSQTISQNNGACQQMSFHKNGTIDKVCPALRRVSDCDTTFWITEAPLNISALPYQGSEKSFTYNDDETYYSNADCIDMPDFSVTQGQTLYFCAYISSGGCTGSMTIYAGNGMSDIETQYSNYYPRSMLEVQDARWLYGSAMQNTWNKTPYYSGYLYDDGDGNRFPQRGHATAPVKVAFGQEKGNEFYFPYNNINLKNMSMIASTTNTNLYYKINLYNITNNTNTLLNSCQNKWANKISNDTSVFHEMLCDPVADIPLNRGYYRLGIECYEDAGYTIDCDGATDYFTLQYSTSYGTTSDPYDFEIGLFLGGIKSSVYINEIYSQIIYSQTSVIFFKLGIDKSFQLEECSDGFDNDFDGTFDYPNDADCSSPLDFDEGNDYNTIYNETCVYDWDCSPNNNCHGEYEYRINIISDLYCTCNSGQCTNFDTKYVPVDTTTGHETSITGSPYIAMQFEDGNFGGFTYQGYNFNTSTSILYDFYIEFDKDRITRPIYVTNHAINPSCFLNLSNGSYLDYTFQTIDFVQIDDTSNAWLFEYKTSLQSDYYYGIVKISQGCQLDWLEFNVSASRPTMTFVNERILISQNDFVIDTINVNTGLYSYPVNISYDTHFISGSYNETFASVESGLCSASKDISVQDLFENVLWTSNMSNFNTEAIFYDDTGVYIRWYDCSIGAFADRYLTKFNSTTGTLIYTIKLIDDPSYTEATIGSNKYGWMLHNLNSLYLYAQTKISSTIYSFVVDKLSGKPVFAFYKEPDPYSSSYYLVKLKENVDYSDWDGLILNNEQKDIYAGFDTLAFAIGSFIDGDTIAPEVSNETFTPECTDGLDNDNDGYTDYPQEPECSSDIDNTEAPYNAVACNDFADNDNDNLTDYPNDPACLSKIGLTEFPQNIPSAQPNNVCLTEEFCIMKEYFPYTDNIQSHLWEGNITDLKPIDNYLTIAIPSGYDNMNGGLEVMNTNLYNEIRFDFELLNQRIADGDSTIYLSLKDNIGRDVINVKYQMLSVLNVKFMDIFLYNGTAYEKIKRQQFSDNDNTHKATLIFDQTEKTFTYEYVSDNTFVNLGTFEWTDILSFKINELVLYADDTDFTNDFITQIGRISLIGNDVELTTYCDEFTLPYYLVETFNGYMRNCEWTTSADIFTLGQLDLTTSTTSFYAKKALTSGAISTKATHVVLSYDVGIDEILTDGELSFSLQDGDGYSFLILTHKADDTKISYLDNGILTTAYTGLNFSVGHTIKAVVSFNSDTFDLYVDNIKVASALRFNNRLYNLNDIGYVLITANKAEISVDNLKIYSSGATGDESLPNEEIPQQIIKTTTWCGLFTKQPTSCNDDTDCETGSCSYNGECSRFDWTYCDNNQKERTQFCMYGAMLSCSLENASDVIFDNFLLVLIFIIFIIGILYLVMFFRRG